ncbi:membrane protein [Microbacterium barkeri]|uniref:Membrane protein n=1 Tax=Microbacterium barkeri TaxID=33917 RepID=A0A9W6LWZ8_9MICO|nr:DUF3105 domain-containing protein [Microbacterium barkeri]MDR6876993.1 hypothetical protein [Microbacterium barkeri]GLJ61916.1 membrane protein [Microbacterium barkeri]
MSTQKRPQKSSGNPARQAEIEQTVKQQREARRQEKLAEYQRQLKKRQRGKLVWWTVGTVAAVAVIGAIVASFVFTPRPNVAEYGIGGDGAEIEGVETFSNTNTHVEGTVEYEQTPPAGGPHNVYWLNCGVYSEPQQNENAVHSLEHGAVWVTYDPELVSGEELETLKGYLPSSYAILSPYPDLGTPVAVSAWNAQLKVDSVDDERIAEFFEEYWRNQNVPEPGAACTGAIDGPGKLS